MNEPEGGLVLLAHITKTHGLRGEFRAVPASGESENLTSLKTLYVRAEGGKPRPFAVVRSRRASGAFIVKLRGVDSVEEAKALVGADLLASPSDLAPLSDGEFYWFQLVGLRVISSSGADLGIVARLFPTGANDVLVVKQGARERLIPYTDDAIAEVDLPRGLIRLSNQPGLEEL